MIDSTMSLYLLPSLYRQEIVRNENHLIKSSHLLYYGHCVNFLTMRCIGQNIQILCFSLNYVWHGGHHNGMVRSLSFYHGFLRGYIVKFSHSRSFLHSFLLAPFTSKTHAFAFFLVAYTIFTLSCTTWMKIPEGIIAISLFSLSEEVDKSRIIIFTENIITISYNKWIYLNSLF